MTSFASSSRRVSFDDFLVGKYIQEGGWGKIYAAVRKSDGKKVALKFFGYTKAKPDIDEINREIGLMIKLDRVQGVCQLVGIFDDTPTGLMENKNQRHLEAFPVLVLEMLEGGDLFNLISKRTRVTEHYLATSFLSAMTALRSIHERGYVHRDLKLDNIMCLQETEPTEVKIIDFGMMIDIPYPQMSLQDSKVMGTEGYFAPETLLRREYGYKSDVWQMGCILYSMLAGHPPFHADPKYRKFVALGKFYPFTGANWADISDAAKDLVTRMLAANPAARPSVTECLAHPWLQDAASSLKKGEEDLSHVMGDQYSQRVKNLVLQSKFKRCFVDNCIRSDHIERRKNFQSELPFLDSENVEANAQKWGINNTSDYMRLGEEYNAKLKKIKDSLLAAMKSKNTSVSDNSNDNYHDEDKDGNNSSRRSRESNDEDQPSKKKMRTNLHQGVDFEQFCALMTSVELDSLATQSVFRIFDVDGDGSIDVREFLLALIALRSRHGGEEEQEAAQLYFSVFDVNEDGHICRDEMAMVIDSLLHDGAGPLFDDSVSARSVDEVFDEIDTDGNGLIDFSEFKKFYDTILATSVITTAETIE